MLISLKVEKHIPGARPSYFHSDRTTEVQFWWSTYCMGGKSKKAVLLLTYYPAYLPHIGFTCRDVDYVYHFGRYRMDAATLPLRRKCPKVPSRYWIYDSTNQHYTPNLSLTSLFQRRWLFQNVSLTWLWNKYATFLFFPILGPVCLYAPLTI